MKIKFLGVILVALLFIIPSIAAEQRIFPVRRVTLGNPQLGEIYYVGANQTLIFPFAEIRNSTTPAQFGGPPVSLLKFREIILELKLCNGQPCGYTVKKTVWSTGVMEFKIYDWGAPELGGLEEQVYDYVYTFVVLDTYRDYMVVQVIAINVGG